LGNKKILTRQLILVEKEMRQIFQLV
jgi:hypothetical protein